MAHGLISALFAIAILVVIVGVVIRSVKAQAVDIYDIIWAIVIIVCIILLSKGIGIPIMEF